MKKILFIVGSQRKSSFNSQMAHYAEGLLNGKAEVAYLDYEKLPIMNEDLENPVLPVVQGAREAVLSADIIWIFTPVYNFAIPGGLKNLLDWLSRSLDLNNLRGESALHNKPVTVSSAANAGQESLFAQLRELLPFIRMRVVEPFTETKINDSAWGDGKLILTSDKIEELKNQVEAVLKAD